MNIFTTVFHEALFRPLFNLLVGITNLLPTHNVGFAIIAVTLLARLALLPSSLHHARQLQRNQDKMAELKKELDNVNRKHKDNKAKRAEETMALYRRAGINPASGCLPLLIQLPILFALFKVFNTGLGPDTYQYLYSFVSHPQVLHSVFFSVPLAEPNVVFAVLAGIAQFVQMRFFNPTPPSQPGINESSEQMMAAMQNNMRYIFPVMTTFFALQFPAALTLYWIVSTLFGIMQQVLIKRMLHLSVTPPAV